MKIYLAGDAYGNKIFHAVNYNFARLESFFYLIKNKTRICDLKRFSSLMLDSGAFTFIMAKEKISIDVDSFTDEYIDFINEHDIKLFFEMDVDSIFGYEKVKQLRERIEKRTGKQCIPVFHMNRGYDDFKEMCKDYKYVALGMAGKDIAWNDAKTMLKFVLKARELGCRVHGLGVTGMKVLTKVPFYSVDSSGWTTGNRYKGIFVFDGKEVKRAKLSYNDKRIADHKALALHNLNEWIKFSKFAEGRL